MLRTLIPLLPAAVLLLAGCGDDSAFGGGRTEDEPAGRVFLIKPGDNATADMIAAMVQAAPGDTIQFDCGYFELTTALQLINTEDVRVKGCGRDRSVLSFKRSDTPEGILIVGVHGVTIEDLSVLDTGGNGIEMRAVDHGTLRRVRAIWSSGGGRESPDPITAANFGENNARRLNVPCTDPASQNPADPLSTDGASPDYTVSNKSGRYGIYPVSSRNILIEESESIGASDAGIYVGQTTTAIIKNSRAAYNVFGFEIENVQGGEYDGNLGECNTGGFLVYDLDGLQQYGDRTRMFGNVVRNNNSYNFASGGLVGDVPPGTGIITLSYDRIDIFDNEIRDNGMFGFLHFSYELLPPGGRPSEHRIDWYSEGVHLFRNKFIHNGYAVPRPTLQDIQSQNLEHFLPALIGIKNAAACAIPTNAASCVAAGPLVYRGAHILWDGLLDAYDPECAYPKDAQGNDVPRDARGKPQLTNEHPDAGCHYNAYKFRIDEPGAPRIVPDWTASCIDADNEFSEDGLKYANFHGTKGLEALINSNIDPADPTSLATVIAALDPAALAEFPSSFDLSPHQCMEQFGKNLALLPPVVIPPFVRSGDFDPGASAAQVAALCAAAVGAGEVNFGAVNVNCPTLDQYHLFADPADPTSAPNGGGMPFVLNTKLFSDYMVKYRVAYLPPGTSAVYNDHASNGVNATIVFPAGTILAKTFSVAREDTGVETPVETRLLIKRVSRSGRVRWDGVPYVWGETNDGKRVARLALGGGSATAQWHTTDVESGQIHRGSTEKYLIPHANQCLSCHSAEDKEAGASPIGPKIRNLNRPYRSESNFVTEQSRHEIAGRNQVEYLCQTGRLLGCPADLGVDPSTKIASHVERVPTFNKPGDSGHEPNSAEDVEARARAWLESNCQHCHNPRGFAANTGFYLDVFRAVDATYGICKRPTATGTEGRGGRTFDIHPGNVADSVLPFRIGPEATVPAAKMPPLARSVVDEEGHALIEQWIRDVVRADETRYPGSTSCAAE